MILCIDIREGTSGTEVSGERFLVSDRSTYEELAVGDITMDSDEGVKVPVWPRAVFVSSKGAKNDPKMAKIVKKGKKMKNDWKTQNEASFFSWFVSYEMELVNNVHRNIP